MKSALLMLIVLLVPAQGPLATLQAVHPGASIECRPNSFVIDTRAPLQRGGVVFECVEAASGGLYGFWYTVSAEALPQEWPNIHSIFVRRFLYAKRVDGEIVYLQTKPTACDDDYASGGRGQLDTSACGGFLFPAWERSTQKGNK